MVVAFVVQFLQAELTTISKCGYFNRSITYKVDSMAAYKVDIPDTAQE